MGVEVRCVGFEDAVQQALQRRIDAALSVADEVPQIIKDQAALENEDVDGQQFPQKQPRPRRNPTNFPNMACVDTGNLFDHARFTTEEVTNTERKVVYDPPSYFTALITKDPDKGGRRWVTPDRINSKAADIITEKMIERFKEAS